MIAAVVSGNLGTDPELRTGDTAILSFSVASNGREKKEGQWQDVTTWVRCTLFGKRAESLASILHKGSTVIVRGALSLRPYEKDGQPRTSLEMRADDLDLVGKRDDGGGSGHGGNGGYGGNQRSGGSAGGQRSGGGKGRGAPPPDDGGIDTDPF